MCFQTVVFPFHPEFFQVKSHGQKEKLCPDVLFSPGQKTPKSKVCFEQRKGAFHLDGTAHTQVNPAFSRNICLRLNPFLPESFFQSDFFRLARILRLAAGISSRAIPAVLATVVSRGHKMSIH